MKKILAVVLTAIVLTLIPQAAHARMYRITERDEDYHGRVRVEFVQRLDDSRWYYVRLTNGAQWMMNRCAYWDSLNCWFDAKVRTHAAPYKTRPYADIFGRTTYLARDGKVLR